MSGQQRHGQIATQRTKATKLEHCVDILKREENLRVHLGTRYNTTRRYTKVIPANTVVVKVQIIVKHWSWKAHIFYSKGKVRHFFKLFQIVLQGILNLLPQSVDVSRKK